VREPCHLLIAASADPRTSGRTAEAVRIAAGVGAWNKVQVDLFLENLAVLATAEFPEELIDGNLFAEYLPALEKHGGRVYVDLENSLLRTITPTVKLHPLSKEEISALKRTAKYVMQFS
jgi:hypothetical protein